MLATAQHVGYQNRRASDVHRPSVAPAVFAEAGPAQSAPRRRLVHDRDTAFPIALDTVVADDGIAVVRTPDRSDRERRRRAPGPLGPAGRRDVLGGLIHEDRPRGSMARSPMPDGVVTPNKRPRSAGRISLLGAICPGRFAVLAPGTVSGVVYHTGRLCYLFHSDV